MKYFTNVQECPKCKEQNHLFTENEPHADLFYSYICSSCSEQTKFKPAIGILVDSLPADAVIIKPV